jgi:transposase-like protein
LPANIHQTDRAESKYETVPGASKYLNNLIEQDHRGVNFESVRCLASKVYDDGVTIAGIELLRRIYKGQFNLRWLRLKDRRTPAIGNTVRVA